MRPDDVPDGSTTTLASCLRRSQSALTGADWAFFNRSRGAYLAAAALVTIVGLAVALRTARISSKVMIFDECFSWRLTEYPVGELAARTAGDVHPPLYYVLLKGWVWVWGLSPPAIRSLSVLFGALSVLMMYLVVVEASRGGCRNGPTVGRRAVTAGLLGALLLAITREQVYLGETARMYTLGVFLTGLTSFLLFRALAPNRPRALYWPLYGVAVAAFCYTHNYAFLTVASQALFASGLLVVRAASVSPYPVKTTAVWLAVSLLIAAALYSPWIPALLHQVRAVRDDYWISSLTLKTVEKTAYAWATGMSYQGRIESIIWVGLFSYLCYHVVRTRNLAGGYFLVIALFPLAASVAVSLGSGRSVFLERCLTFAQFGLMGLIGIGVASVPRLAERTLLAAVFVTACGYGLVSDLAKQRTPTPAVQFAAAYLSPRYAAADTVVLLRPTASNQFRYYCHHLGFARVRTHCVEQLDPGTQHITHAAVLGPGELVPDLDTLDLRPGRRAWVVCSGGSWGSGDGRDNWRAVGRRNFTGQGQEWTVFEYAIE